MLPSLCCSTSALAYWMWRYPPQQNVLHCAIEQRLSLSHWWTANFFSCVVNVEGQGWAVQGFFTFKGTFSIVEYAHLNLLWTESTGMFVHCHILMALMESVEWFGSNVPLEGESHWICEPSSFWFIRFLPQNKRLVSEPSMNLWGLSMKQQFH